MAIRVAAVEYARMSEDGREVLLQTSGSTGLLELRFAVECLDDLIGALAAIKLGGPARPAPAAPARVAPPGPAGTPAPATQPPGNPDEVRFEIPRNFAISADTKRGMVLLIVNHKVERQAGYAFSPDAARQLVEGLGRSAGALQVRRVEEDLAGKP